MVHTFPGAKCLRWRIGYQSNEQLSPKCYYGLQVLMELYCKVFHGSPNFCPVDGETGRCQWFASGYPVSLVVTIFMWLHQLRFWSWMPPNVVVGPLVEGSVVHWNHSCWKLYLYGILAPQILAIMFHPCFESSLHFAALLYFLKSCKWNWSWFNFQLSISISELPCF